MKKQYTAPALQEVIIGMKSLLCSSPATATMSGGSQGNGAALGRGTYWDEDEDEDDDY